jgi:hypothetical protein
MPYWKQGDRKIDVAGVNILFEQRNVNPDTKRYIAFRART